MLTLIRNLLRSRYPDMSAAEWEAQYARDLAYLARRRAEREAAARAEKASDAAA